MSIQNLKLASLILLVLCCGCKSKPETKEKSVQEDTPIADMVGIPEKTPEDWPLTRDEVELLRGDLLKLDPKPLEAAGLYKRSEIVKFAYKVLDLDLSPIERDLILITEGQLKGKAYYLLGLYGALGDAEKHFQDVKSIVHDVEYHKESDNDQRLHLRMVESLGFYLMRDHFMPQNDRKLMIEIEDYLLNCTIIDTPSCWPYPNRDNGNDDLRRYALNALAYSCSDRAKEQIKTYLAQPKELILHIAGECNQRHMEEIEARADEIREKLLPGLSEKEMEE